MEQVKTKVFESALQQYMEDGGSFDGKEYSDPDDQAMFMAFWIGVEYAKGLKEST